MGLAFLCTTSTMLRPRPDIDRMGKKSTPAIWGRPLCRLQDRVTASDRMGHGANEVTMKKLPMIDSGIDAHVTYRGWQTRQPSGRHRGL